MSVCVVSLTEPGKITAGADSIMTKSTKCKEGLGPLHWNDILPLEKFVADGAPQPRPKRIFFQSNGIADEDLAGGKYVLDQAKRKKMKVKKVTEI